MLEREVLKASLKILNSVFKEYVHVERRQVAMVRNPSGQVLRFGKKGEADIGGYIIKGKYMAKPLAIEVKRGDFRPGRLSGEHKAHFESQCAFLRAINQQGGVGFWINNPTHLYTILTPALINGATVTLDQNHCVVVKRLVLVS